MRFTARTTSLLSIPRKKINVWLLALLWLLSMPVVEYIFYYTIALRGETAPGENLVATMTAFVFGWIIISIPVLGVIWFCLREYPGAVTFFAFNNRRPLWSVVWTIVGILYLVSLIRFIFMSILGRYPADVIQSLVEVYLTLCLRSSVIYSTAFARKPKLNQGLSNQ